MSITSRHRFELAVIIAVAFLAGVIFAHTTGIYRKTFDTLFDLWIAGFGSAMIFYPQWFYQRGTPEQLAGKWKRSRFIGFGLLAVALFQLCLRLF